MHRPDELIFDPEYLGVSRLNIVFVQITFVAGRSREIKLDLVRRLAANLGEAGVRTEDVMVTLTENSLEDWSVGNGIAQLIELGSVPGALSLDGERAGVEAGQVGEGGAALGVKVEAR